MVTLDHLLHVLKGFLKTSQAKEEQRSLVTPSFVFSLIFLVLFVRFLAVLCLHCRAWASPWGGFSCCGAGLRKLQYSGSVGGSVLVAQGLSLPEARGSSLAKD